METPEEPLPDLSKEFICMTDDELENTREFHFHELILAQDKLEIEESIELLDKIKYHEALWTASMREHHRRNA